METNEDKKLDQLIGKSIRLMSLDSPSQGFEEHILQKIQTLGINNKAPYKPLISKLTWSLLGVGFLALITYLFATSDGQASLWFKNMNDEVLNLSKYFKTFNAIKFSSTIFYSVMCFFILVTIQLPILKRYFDKQLGAS